MNEIHFAWDDNKAALNWRKHGIRFDEAATVFWDTNAILFDDPDHSEEEERFMLLGMSREANLLVVCHCYRESDTVIRLISARKSTKSERTEYYKLNGVIT